jgi:hypothetical protein
VAADGEEAEVILCSVTLTTVAFLRRVTESGAPGGRCPGWEGGAALWTLLSLSGGRLVVLVTFLEQMVMEEKLTLSYGTRVVVVVVVATEAVSRGDGRETPSLLAVDPAGWALPVL